MKQCILSYFNVHIGTASAFYRAKISGKTYYSRLYIRTDKRNSYTIGYVDCGQHKFGFINYFISLSSCSVAVVTPLTPNSSYCYPQQLRVLHQCIIPVSVEQSVVIVPTQCIMYKCVCIDSCGVTFLARLPNQLCID